MKFPPIKKQLEIIRRGTTEIVPEEELVSKLESSKKTGNPLKIKLGCDPTRPDLHLGHSVILRKMRQFQDLGHHAILIIGDFTGMIGDPTGQNKTRPSLSIDEIRKNGQTYFKQASKILDPEKTEIIYNSDWLGTMTFQEIIQLASRFTVARMMERDDFQNRFQANEPISLHEFLYPLAQGQDSVHLQNDVELGGNDQKFNLLVGRALQRDCGFSPQVCLMMPLLIGTDGRQKMSKSYDNYIGLDEPPNDMYGKALSIPDELIYTYFELVTDVPIQRLEEKRALAEENPRDAKHDLAYTIVGMYHGEAGAKAAKDHFEKVIINKDVPDDIPALKLEAGKSYGILTLMSDHGLSSSNGEARRLIKQGGVSLDGNILSDPGFVIHAKEQLDTILKVGKRKFLRLIA